MAAFAGLLVHDVDAAVEEDNVEHTKLLLDAFGESEHTLVVV